MSGTGLAQGLALPRVVVLAEADALAAPREWAWAMDEAGADGLALQGRPEEPTTTALLGALVAAGLPLELHVPGQPPEWAQLAPLLLEHPDLNAVVPEQKPAAELAQRLAADGCALAWPGEAGPSAPAWVWRWHWKEGAVADYPGGLPSEAPFERSLEVVDPGSDLPGGVTTVVLPGAVLDAVDPGATIAHLRPEPALPSGAPGA